MKMSVVGLGTINKLKQERCFQSDLDGKETKKKSKFCSGTNMYKCTCIVYNVPANAVIDDLRRSLFIFSGKVSNFLKLPLLSIHRFLRFSKTEHSHQLHLLWFLFMLR